MWYVLQALKDKLLAVCKCHGASGSCSSKTCWTALPPFRAIGDHLMRKYKNAKQVLPERAGRAYKPLYLKLQHDEAHTLKPGRRELVFLDTSPDYCQPSAAHGIIGTSGRVCSLATSGVHHCGMLCCGRGYDTVRYERSAQCNCKFIWCCQVKCQNCTEQVTVRTCK